jgi:glycosyltransferase involved in cell wall biosynthesis
VTAPGSKHALYVSYDGALDPLGRSQVVPYLEGLSALGWRFDLVTFEKDERWRDEGSRRAMQERLAASAIGWSPLRYHKRPPVLSTAFDVSAAARRLRELVRERRPALIHARSYPAALAARLVGRGEGVPYVFDMRGFYAEERVDGGIWPEGGALYRATKRVERDLLRDAAAVVTLTQASVPLLRGWISAAGGDPLLRVIPTCVDLARFQPAPPTRSAPAFELAYFGSIGTWYLLDEMLRFGRAVLDAAGGGRLLFLTNGDPAAVRARAVAVGLDPALLRTGSVPHERVPEALADASATFFFIRPGASRFAFHQTKLGESLALGLPVAANRGIGDTDALPRDGVGVLVDGLDEASYAAAARALVELARDPATAGRCRAVAQERYALELGVRAYAELYEAVAARGRR